MTTRELHDHLEELKSIHLSADTADGEYRARLGEIIESLEQQQLYPEKFDQYSALQEQMRQAILEYEARHPRLKIILDSIQDTLQSFRV